MKTSIFATALATAASAVGAVLPRANSLGFIACTDLHLTGFCKHYTNLVEGRCYTLFPDFAGQDSISSVNADIYAYCSMFPNDVCDPSSGNDNDMLNVRRPGYYDLSDPEIGWNGKPRSFSCVESW